MPEKRQDRPEKQRAARFKEILGELAHRGITQRQAAVELNVPAQYVSDVKNGHRNLTEQFARRIAERYDLNFIWLMTGEGAKSIPRHEAGVTLRTDTILLPVLSEPTSGDPAQCSAWDGSKIALSGAAEAMAARASRPYVLRVARDDVAGRLRKHDLILVSQEPDDSATLAVVQHRGRCLLAQRAGKGERKAIDTGRRVAANATVVGRCLGIVWASL